jgi:ABC-type maltose transport system permease subunit
MLIASMHIKKDFMFCNFSSPALTIRLCSTAHNTQQADAIEFAAGLALFAAPFMALLVATAAGRGTGRAGAGAAAFG